MREASPIREAPSFHRLNSFTCSMRRISPTRDKKHKLNFQNFVHEIAKKQDAELAGQKRARERARPEIC